MTQRDKLIAFYQSLKQRSPLDLSVFAELVGPDLIWMDDQYITATPRVVIIGQQIDGWDYTYIDFVWSWSVTDAIARYRDFDFGLNYYSTPFWQFFHEIRECFFPIEPELRRRVLWTNLVKFVANDRTSILWKPYFEEALRLQDDVLKTELSIADPDICIFVTGPNYDEILKRYFPGLRFEHLALPVRQFAKLSHNELPERSYRTYHPRYLRQGKLWEAVTSMLTTELKWPIIAP